MDTIQRKKILNVFILIGFTEISAEEQLSKLGEIINLSIINTILVENPEIKTSEEIIRIINEKYKSGDQKDKFAKIIFRETNNYLEAISKSLSPIKRQEFSKQLSEINFDLLVAELNISA